MPYQTGKSMLFVASGIIGAGQANTNKRVGLFDDNNGLYFELAGTTLNVVRRSFVTGVAVNTAVAQSSWNLDKLDGTGASGKTLDLTDIQIFIIDLQWLGAGRVRFGFDIDGQVIYCHELRNANNLTSVYMSTPYLPVRWEIVNTGVAAATASVEMVCAQVSCEGEFDPIGMPFSCNTGITSKSVPNANLIPLIRFRAKSAQPRAPFQLKELTVIGTAADNILWQLMLNPTVTGGTGPTYNAAGSNNYGVNANSYFEFDIASTGSVTLGTVLASGYTTSVSRIALSEFNNHLLNIMGADASGTRDELILAAQNVSGGSTNVLASMEWVEYT
jgi:hypothetical protein